MATQRWRPECHSKRNGPIYRTFAPGFAAAGCCSRVVPSRSVAATLSPCAVGCLFSAAGGVRRGLPKLLACVRPVRRTSSDLGCPPLAGCLFSLLLVCALGCPRVACVRRLPPLVGRAPRRALHCWRLIPRLAPLRGFSGVWGCRSFGGGGPDSFRQTDAPRKSSRRATGTLAGRWTRTRQHLRVRGRLRVPRGKKGFQAYVGTRQRGRREREATSRTSRTHTTGTWPWMICSTGSTRRRTRRR